MSEETGTGQQSTKKRFLWIAGMAILLVAVGLVVMNLSAGKADGAADGDGSSAAEDSDTEKGEDEDKEKAPVPVEVAEIKSGEIAAFISSTANLVAENQVRMLSEVEGRVAKLFVEEGDFVRQGQVLATLARDDEEINLKKAELKETNAKLAFDRGEDLMRKELISREDFDKSQMDFEIAEQEMAEARWMLEKTTIRAPFSGQISERLIQVGQNVRPSDELFQLTDLDPLVARIFLPERDVIGLEHGAPVRIALNAEAEAKFDGQIRRISPVVDTATGTIKVTIEAIKPPASVRPGSFVTIDIVRETRADAILVPREAVLRELQSAHIFLVEDGVAKKRAVELGLEEGDWVQAMTGVSPGDRVIVAGQGGLRDGAPVKLISENDEAESAAATGEAS